jgi:inorganic pyrophosphatase
MAGKTQSRRRAELSRLPSFAGKSAINVIIETPKGKRNKFRYDEKLGLFRLGKVLPAGFEFPYDFGFVPRTRAEDGDPVDVLVLMDESAYPGCLVTARLIGVIEAMEEEDGEQARNDRLIAVAEESKSHRNLRSIRDLSEDLLKELEHFFQSSAEMSGKEFKLLRARGPRRARRALKKCLPR